VRIAIVGAGISGLTAAYLLSRAHEVELFERNDYAGGHTNTVTLETPSGELGLDTGFIVYNETTYPGFTRLLAGLGVATQPSEMSLAVSCRPCDLEYSSRGARGMLAQPINLARPRRWRFAWDIYRFFRTAGAAMTSENLGDATLSDFISRERYGSEFRRHFVVPLVAAVWSTPPHEADAFPAQHFLRFIHNHGLIGRTRGLRWRTVSGGSQTYVKRLLAAFPGRTRLSAPVTAVRRGAADVQVMVAGGEWRTFDKVVLACHADEALALLVDPGDEERSALAAFTYTPNRIVLHTDATVLPKRKAARASWNYTTADCRRPGAPLALTYHLNRLQAIGPGVDYCVSVNPRLPICPESVIRELSYDHPRFTFETIAAQKRIEALNGERHTYFAGAHLGYGFHEDGFQSAVRVARHLGVEP
jgi:predicted NAD/FAD-binding protein